MEESRGRLTSSDISLDGHWRWRADWLIREQVLSYLRRADRFGNGEAIVRSHLTGRRNWLHLWYLLREADGRISIGLDTLVYRQPCWGYYEQHEREFLYELDCPLSFIRQASPVLGKVACWRAKVRQYHRDRQLHPRAGPGIAIKCGVFEHRLVSQLNGGWQAERLPEREQVVLSTKEVAQGLREVQIALLYQRAGHGQFPTGF